MGETSPIRRIMSVLDRILLMALVTLAPSFIAFVLWSGSGCPSETCRRDRLDLGLGLASFGPLVALVATSTAIVVLAAKDRPYDRWVRIGILLTVASFLGGLALFETAWT